MNDAVKTDRHVSQPVQQLLATPMAVGESPLWDPDKRCLFWVDNVACEVHSFDPATAHHRVLPMPSVPGCICRAPDGNLIVALRSGFHHLCIADGSLRLIAAAPYDERTSRFNDGRCDAAGRFWVGSMYEPRDQPLGALYCLERGVVRMHFSGLTVANGLAFSADQHTLYQADTSAHLIRRHHFDVRTGVVGSATPFHQFAADKSAPTYGGRPDGAAVDSEGAYWCAMYEGGCLLRLSPRGEILQRIDLPLRCPTMVAFGGADLRTLYITSARHGRPEAELRAQPWSGCLLSLQVPIAGLPEPVYLA